MNVTLRGGARSGCVRIPASKSQAHRLRPTPFVLN